MVTASVLRQILADRESLRGYASGALPNFDQVKRRLFLLEREQDHRLPDHFYKRGGDFFLARIKCIPHLLTVGLHRLGDEHLMLEGTKIYVKKERWPEWQDLLGFCSPLVCISAFLWKRWKEDSQGKMQPVEDLEIFLRNFIEPNTRHTCLPAPHYPTMEAVLKNGGLSDLHVHLNGSTETDVAWQDFLKNPNSVYFEIAKSSRNEKVLDQMEQEFACASPLEFYQLLRTAIRLRYGFVHLLFDGVYTPELEKPLKNLTTENMVRSGGLAEDLIDPRAEHPLQRVFRQWPESVSRWPDVSLEALLYVLVMDRIEATGDPKLAAWFHHYLLILGLFNRFLVQQSHQYGFDQFQKITLNEFRSLPEKSYARRFSQMHGNQASYLAVLEGRFAPKSAVPDTIKLLNNIIKGWEHFQKQCQDNSVRQPQLHLVCHFIKEKDQQTLHSEEALWEPTIRHRALRLQNAHRARSLVMARDLYPGIGKYLAGVDAASNELEAPPEVFAPVYRFLRRKNFRHFTYHAGEDFHHLIGGLRAMYEAVVFLGFDVGDRIGHGTAAGIDPGLWLDRMTGHFVMSQGEWLDDLVFAAHFAEKDRRLAAVLDSVNSKVRTLAKEVYGQEYSMEVLVRGWLARRWCPFHLLYEYGEVTGLPTFSEEEWHQCQEAMQDKEAVELVKLHHRSDCRKRYHEKIMVQTEEFFGRDELRILQDLLLSELHRRGIVLEVLPTSNVRISYYKSHKEHHIWRWLRMDEGDNRTVLGLPPVVLGTDDTGIFSTNIFNEYCHIYHHLRHLVKTRKLGHDAGSKRIEEVIKNANRYAFTGRAEGEKSPQKALVVPSPGLSSHISGSIFSLGQMGREKLIIKHMTTCYCLGNRHCASGVCLECSEFLRHVFARLEACAFLPGKKPVCGTCRVNCFDLDKRRKFAEIMRKAGLRMMIQHPLLTLAHLCDALHFR